MKEYFKYIIYFVQLHAIHDAVVQFLKLDIGHEKQYASSSQTLSLITF